MDQVFSDERANLLIWDISCNGSERSLTECVYNVLGQTLCNPLEDAGVVCQGNTHIN